jgi:hypothetical protein
MKPHKRNTQLGEKIEPFEFPFEESAWTSLAANLAAQAKPPMPEWMKRLFFLGLLFLTMVLGVFISRKKESSLVVSTKSGNITNFSPMPEQHKGDSQRFKVSNTFVETLVNNDTYIFKNGKNSVSNPVSAIKKSELNLATIPVKNTIFNKTQTVKKANNKDIAVSNNAKTLDNQGIIADENDKKNNVTPNTPIVTDSNSIRNLKANQPFYAQFNTNVSENAQEQKSFEKPVFTEIHSSAMALPSTQVEPLSLQKHTTISSLNANFWADVSPTIPYISPSKRLKNRHQVTIGAGTGFFITQFHGSKSAFGAYTYRLSPMSAIGTSINYTKTPDGGYATNIEGQINIYLAERRRFAWLLTTGYGYRRYNLLDDNTPPYQSYVNDKAKGLTLGTEFHYKFSNRSFIGLRLDSKINYSQNTGLFLQYGINF